MSQVDAAVRSAFAPRGLLRASINLGNPLLATRAAGASEPSGVSVDLTRELARRLGVEVELVVFEKAQGSVEAVEQDRADIGFFAIDPKRGQHIAFTLPYLEIEGSYLVRDDSPLQSNDEVDCAAHQVVVVGDSAYDLYLSRALKQARIVRLPNATRMVEEFAASANHEVLASLRQVLVEAAGRVTGVRLLPGRFMVIHQAMGVAKHRGEPAQAFLSRFVEDMKAEGFVAESIARHRVQGATVASAASVLP